MRGILFLLFVVSLSWGNSIDEVKKTVLNLLEIDEEPTNLPRPSQTTNVAVRYMQELYKSDMERGQTIQSVTPFIGLDGDHHEVLVFPIEQLKINERIQKAEIHLLGRNTHKTFNAFMILGENEVPLKVASGSPRSLVWSIPIDRLTSSDTSIIVRIKREDRRQPRMTTLIHRHTPFLTVWKMESQEVQTIRRKRDTGRNRRSDYFAYNNRVDEENRAREEHMKLGPSVLKTKKKSNKFNVKKYEQKKDPWYGFGKEMVSDDGEPMGEEDGQTLDSTTVLNSGHVNVVLLDDKHLRQNKDCTRFPLWIDFSEIGWEDFIVAPAKFDAGYCAGECRYPLAKEVNASNHAYLQSILAKSSGAPSVTCGPDKLEGMSVLFRSKYGITLKTYPRMRVESCGCV